MTKRRLLEEARNSTWQISVQNVISNFLILILLFVSYYLISFNFYLFYFPGAAAMPLGSARGALRAPRSSGWEPLVLVNGWAPGTVWKIAENLASTCIRSPDLPARSESLYRLSNTGPLVIDNDFCISLMFR